MSIPFFLLGALAFFFVLFRTSSGRTLIMLPLVFLLLSVLSIVLTKGGGFLGQVSSAFQSVAIGIIIAMLVRRNVTGKNNHREVRRAVLAALLIITILTFQNLINIETLLSVEKDSAVMTANPWGIVILLLIIIHAITHRVDLNDEELFQKIQILVLTASFLLIAVDLLVVAGFLEGNTKKVGEGLGGRGLANLSTNETGILGTSLLLWNLIYLFRAKRFNLLHLAAGSGSFAMIIFAKSRIALGLSLLLFGLYFFYSEVRMKTKIAVFVPVMIIILLLAAVVIQERTTSDVMDNPNNPLTELPGSGRPLIWFYYLDAFIYTAQSNPVQWLTGVGVPGLVTLYHLTPLEKFSLTLGKIDFFPLHSDLVKIFLISGSIGFIAWLLIPYYLLKIPKISNDRFQTTAALVILFIFTSADMLNYFPLGTMLLMSAFSTGIQSYPFEKGVRSL